MPVGGPGACPAWGCTEKASGECQLLKWTCGSTERLYPKITISPRPGLGCSVMCGTKKGQLWPKVQRLLGLHPVCISVLLLLLSCPLRLSSLRLVSSPFGHPFSLVAFKAKRALCVMDLSASQGGGREHSSDQCFCNLCNRATNLCDRTASLPALESGRRWPRSHRSVWNLACPTPLPTLFSSSTSAQRAGTHGITENNLGG